VENRRFCTLSLYINIYGRTDACLFVRLLVRGGLNPNLCTDRDEWSSGLGAEEK